MSDILLSTYTKRPLANGSFVPSFSILRTFTWFNAFKNLPTAHLSVMKVQVDAEACLSLLFVLCRSVYCLYANTATGWLPFAVNKYIIL